MCYGKVIRYICEIIFQTGGCFFSRWAYLNVTPIYFIRFDYWLFVLCVFVFLIYASWFYCMVFIYCF